MNTRDSVLKLLKKKPLTLDQLQEQRPTIVLARLIRMEEAGEIEQIPDSNPAQWRKSQ